MAADLNDYIVATFALWAGDIRYFEDLLSKFSLARSKEPYVQSPEDVIRRAGALRLRQLWQRRGEFKRLAAEVALADQLLTDQPLVLETEHLRGAVWRTGEREFLLKAYLSDLSWESALFKLAKQQAGVHGDLMNLNREQDDMFTEEQSPMPPLTTSWPVSGNPFVQVVVNDLGLIEASAIWTDIDPPSSGTVITGAFVKVLHSLDSPAPIRQGHKLG